MTESVTVTADVIVAEIKGSEPRKAGSTCGGDCDACTECNWFVDPEYRGIVWTGDNEQEIIRFLETNYCEAIKMVDVVHTKTNKKGEIISDSKFCNVCLCLTDRDGNVQEVERGSVIDNYGRVHLYGRPVNVVDEESHE